MDSAPRRIRVPASVSVKNTISRTGHLRLSPSHPALRRGLHHLTLSLQLHLIAISVPLMKGIMSRREKHLVDVPESYPLDESPNPLFSSRLPGTTLYSICHCIAISYMLPTLLSTLGWQEHDVILLQLENSETSCSWAGRRL